MMYFRIIIAVIILNILQCIKQTHMLQQNSYNMDSHLIYLRAHKNKFVANMCLLFISLLYLLPQVHNSRIYFIKIAWYVLVTIYMLVILIENLPRKMIKPLVVTERVIRLFITEFIINILFFIPFIVYVLFNIKNDNFINAINNAPVLYVVLIIVATCIEFLIVYFANFINKPIEKLVRKGFIDDAKKILKDCPNLDIIGITGSYGKTSTKYFLQEILQEKFECLITPNSYNTPMGVVKTIREKLKSTHEIFICEMGARRIGDIKEICDIVSPHHAIITSVGPQHLDTFKTIENVHKTKFELANSATGIKLVEYGLCNEDGFYTFGLNEKATFYAKNIWTTSNGTIFTFVDNIENTATNFKTTLLGNNNIKDLVCAIGFAKLYGMKEDEMLLPVKKLKAVKHRLELLQENDMTFIDDAYNSNPVGSKEALNVLKLFDTSTKIVITPGMVELGKREEELNRNFARECTESADYIYLVGESRTKALKDEIEKTNFDKNKLKVFNKVQDAINEARNLNETNKVCLLENDLPDNY